MAHRSAAGALAAVVAAAIAILCEAAVWAGQPPGGATAPAVLEYYGGHAFTVVSGDVLWIGALMLLAAAVLAGAETLNSHRAVFVTAAVPALSALMLSAVLAAWLALTAPQQSPAAALHLWQAEGTLYEIGSWLLLAPVALALLQLRGVRLGAMALVTAAVLAVFLTAGGVWGFTLELAWFAALPATAALRGSVVRRPASMPA